MSDPTTPALPTYPNIPSPLARFISTALEKLLTTGAVGTALMGATGLPLGSVQQFAAVAVGLALYGASWLIGLAKDKAAHANDKALLMTPPPKA